MRHTTVLLACLLLAGAATGCGSSGGDDKSAAKPSASSTAGNDARYLKAARQIKFNGTPTDGDLLLYPDLWCKGLDAGHSVKWLFGIHDGGLYPVGEDWGTAKADADTLLVAGVKVYCPKNSGAVLDELRASGEY
ncbi:hypothetical protein [Streptomyces sp. NPDC127038]|uniref:hypothetical protein n=1 Tax=Streptomyces sp. NPDC127038 TaxID=3347114 RepID=UPI003649FA7F